MKSKDFLVETKNPAALDTTLIQLGAALVEDGAKGYLKTGGYYVMRTFGNAEYIKFMCETQGYCKIIREPVEGAV